jgi:hypothetical protein
MNRFGRKRLYLVVFLFGCIHRGGSQTYSGDDELKLEAGRVQSQLPEGWGDQTQYVYR